MRWRLAIPVGAMVLTLGSASGAAAAPVGVLDQQQATHDQSTQAEGPIAQTFVPGTIGTLSTLSLWFDYVGGSGAATQTLGICTTTAGLPNCAPTSTITDPLPAGYLALQKFTVGNDVQDAWVDFVFTAPPTLTQGTQYAIVMPDGLCAWGFAHDPDSYASGAASTYGEGWVLMGGGSSPISDFTFRTYIPGPQSTPPPTSVAATGELPAQPGSLPILLGVLAAAGAMVLTFRSRRLVRTRR